MEDPDVWNNPERAQSLGKERSVLEGIVSTIDNMTSGLGDASELLEMSVEEQDEEVVDSVVEELDDLSTQLEALEFRRMFLAKWTRIMRMWIFSPAPVVPRLRIGPI